ncbi:MAG: ATP-binding protein [Ruminococcaceae bacterium]|nr:ATP-binding protein [Oscillospiraceae bacterium]
MKFSEDVYIKAEVELKKRRDNAEQLAEMRRKQILNKHPELSEIENIIRNAALEVIKGLGSGKSVDVKGLSEKNLKAQKEKAELLTKNGYPEDYLEPQYSCKLCNDSGILNGKLCSCHLEILKKISMSEYSCSSILAVSTFDTFDLKYYSAEKDMNLGYSPREYMEASFDFLKSYAENFNKNSSSFFFTGATGLGKTHLSLAVMNKVTEKGFSVFYGSADNIIKQMEKERFGRSNGDIEEEIENADLLIIDDLGTEFKTAFSETAVYQLINNAILNGKPMIISSNLSIDELEERYGQRVVSRLNSFEVVNFIGTDIRQIKK